MVLKIYTDMFKMLNYPPNHGCTYQSALKCLCVGHSSGFRKDKPRCNSHINHPNSYVGFNLRLTRGHVTKQLDMAKSAIWCWCPDWPLASPGHQESWYWQCRINGSPSFTRDSNDMWHLNIEKCLKRWIWVRSRRCGCLVTWFCYHLIAKPGSKTAAPSWPDPYVFILPEILQHDKG